MKLTNDQLEKFNQEFGKAFGGECTWEYVGLEGRNVAQAIAAWCRVETMREDLRLLGDALYKMSTQDRIE